MLTVTIELTGKTWADLDVALEEVRGLLQEEYLTGTNSHEDGSFFFDVTGEEETREGEK